MLSLAMEFRSWNFGQCVTIFASPQNPVNVARLKNAIAEKQKPGRCQGFIAGSFTEPGGKLEATGRQLNFLSLACPVGTNEFGAW
jgi:hypothetical protein